jgi:hypothetical protein
VKVVRRAALAALATLGALLYVWVAAVRAAPEIRRRKAARHAARRAAH